MITIGGYRIDATISESHDSSSDVTGYPVESGGNVVDHIREKPQVITMACIISDAPLDKDLAALRAKELGLASGTTTISRNAYDVLAAMKAKHELIEVETSLGIRKNMVFAGFVVQVDGATGEALAFTATLQQVDIVTNKRTTVRVAIPRAKAAKLSGLVPTVQDQKDVATMKKNGFIEFDGYGNVIDPALPSTTKLAKNDAAKGAKPSKPEHSSYLKPVHSSVLKPVWKR